MSTFEKNSVKPFELSSEAEREEHFEFTPLEITEMEQYELNLQKIYDYLLFHKYEIDHNFSNADWLKIYATTVTDYSFDMTAIA